MIVISLSCINPIATVSLYYNNGINVNQSMLNILNDAIKKKIYKSKGLERFILRLSFPRDSNSYVNKYLKNKQKDPISQVYSNPPNQ